METGGNEIYKKNRVRRNPNRKWSSAEENALLNFLMDNKDFEKPSAQSYYKRFSEEKSVLIDWKLVRSKVRNMRVMYNKAKAWEGSTGAGSMEGATIRSTLHQMCSFYEEFEEVFGSRIVDSTIIEESLVEEFLSPTETEFDDSTLTSECSQLEIEVLPSLPSGRRKGIYSRTAVSDIMEMQSETIALKKQKMSQDLAIKEREVNMKEKEVKLKERELELKEKEINSNEKLKILELEMKERLAREELKLKYKQF